MNENTKQKLWVVIILSLILIISVLHFSTPKMQQQYHLLYMQAYFIPILFAAFKFGIKGGIGSAVIVSIVYFPHIMLQHGGIVEGNLIRFLQIILFNIIGYFTGLNAQREKEEKSRYLETAEELKISLQNEKMQSEKMQEMEEQLRAADRLAVVGELTASLAHEVRNPLGSIRGAVEILRDESPKEQKKSEFFQILIDDTERINSVVENYLNFSKKHKQRDSIYKFQEIIQNVSKMLSTHARKNLIRINLDLPDEPIKLKGDPNDLWQILMNVILNAIQALNNGGEIKIDLKKETLSKENKSEKSLNHIYDSYLNLSISDNGPGISNIELKDLFKPFYTTKSNGSGLGLAIVKRIADNNNWSVSIKSNSGLGTEFVIIIPLKE